MKIIIDIPDGYVGVIMSNQRMEGSAMDKLIRQAIIDGTPLPKGHGRLIDADEIQFENAEFDTYGDYCRAFDSIDQADTIIEADKKKSEE